MKKKKGISTLQGEAVHENQDGVKHPVEPPKNVPEERKFSSSASNAELESALNKFFGGPLYCLILSECIGAHTGPRTRKRAGKGGAQSSRLSYPIVSWMDVLSEATTADQFELQKNGMYRCHVKGRVVEMSAENYHFISLGYPQRMMQSSRPSEAAQGEQEAAGDVGKQGTQDRSTTPYPTQWTYPDAQLHQISHIDLRKTLRFHTRVREMSKEPPKKPKSSKLRHHGSAPTTEIATNPLISEERPIKSDITSLAQGGSTGSSDVPKPSQSEASSPTNKDKQPATPVRPKKHKKQNFFIPWTPSPKKETRTQESPDSSNTSPRAGPSVRYSSRELNEGPAFIKALIEAGKPWEEQEELYASEFGISRSQFRLMKKFDLGFPGKRRG
ncbi:unnamed protein product [Penicillium nalgiovense]|nr:unnamed protein product [Penicillium nalgiovense]